jgi:carboxypeptidase C (cathepsin A)
MKIYLLKCRLTFFSLFSTLFICTSGWTENQINAEKKSETTASKCIEKESFVETLSEIIINGKPFFYRAVAGNLLLKNDKCEPTASLFFVSYTKDGENLKTHRPITFCFNGGPGSSSVWLHIGLLGPKRVVLNENGDALPPYQLTENTFSLLSESDLVFIDPVSTGYSRAIPQDDAKKFHGVEEDVKSVAEFIRLYLTRFNRWDSPKFILGESYGTTRAAGLAGYLHDDEFININGLVLISSVLNFPTLDFYPGNDLPYLLFLPSYTATAWYHHKLSPSLQQKSLTEVIQEARDFVLNKYAAALFKGNLLKPQEKEHLAFRLAELTGLSIEYIVGSNLRIDMMRFAKELLRKQQRTVGRFDSRFKGVDADAVGENFEYDPSAEAIFGAFTATFNQYLKTDLKWSGEMPYKILSNVFPWNYGSKNQALDVTDTLRSVMTKNPHLRVFVGNGYYDLATPFFATEYTFNHLGLNEKLLKHLTLKYYEAGHMMYIYRPALIALTQDLQSFYQQTLKVDETFGY